MSGMEDKLGPGHQQIVLGLLIFASGALWGIMLASGDGDIDLADLYVSAVVMLSGAMITLLAYLDRVTNLMRQVTERHNNRTNLNVGKAKKRFSVKRKNNHKLYL